VVHQGPFSVIFEKPIVAIQARNFCSMSPTLQMEVGIKRSLTTFSAVASASIGSDRSEATEVEKSDEETFIGYGWPSGIRRSRSRIGCRYARQGSAAPACSPDIQLDRLLHRSPVGGAWTDTDWFYACSARNLLIPPCGLAQGGHSASSWLAGGQVGFNYQVGRFVWGIEADFSATRLEGRNLDAAFPLQEFLHSRTDFIGTVAPRVGIAWDRVLLYAKGGLAWAHDDYWLTLTPNQLLAGQTFVTGDATRVGSMVGVGVEYAFAQNWSVKAEYNYMDFGTERILVKSTGIEPTQPNFDEDIGRKIQVVKVGLNYKFDWGGPLAGRY